MLPAQTFTTALKFAAHAMAKKDVRYYLCGVLFEFDDDTLHLVGLDGARQAFVSLTLSQPAGFAGRYIVKADSVKLLLATFGKSKGEVTFQRQIVGGFSVGVAALHLAPDLHDGAFPSWRRVVPAPERDNAPCPALDANFLSEAAAALAPLTLSRGGTRALRINAGVNQDAVVFRPRETSDPQVKDAAVIVMPVRD